MGLKNVNRVEQLDRRVEESEGTVQRQRLTIESKDELVKVKEQTMAAMRDLLLEKEVLLDTKAAELRRANSDFNNQRNAISQEELKTTFRNSNKELRELRLQSQQGSNLGVKQQATDKMDGPKLPPNRVTKKQKVRPEAKAKLNNGEGMQSEEIVY